MSDVRRVLVVGGGVGGLTAAAAFAQRGVEVVLIERRPHFDIAGVGLGQPANALRVYDALGVLPQILAAGFTYDRMCIFDANWEGFTRRFDVRRPLKKERARRADTPGSHDAIVEQSRSAATCAEPQ